MAEKHLDLSREIIYRDLWPGIDLIYRSESLDLKHDFIIHAGAEPATVRVRYEGIESLSINDSGELVIETAIGTLKEKAPYIFQEVDGHRVQVTGAFEMVGTDTVGYRVSAYDSSRPLMIDPALAYSTYLGGSRYEHVHAITADAEGNTYVTGRTKSSDFPTTAGLFNETHNGYYDAFVAKLNPQGSGLVYSTFLGGSCDDYSYSIGVDGAGNAYVTGCTESEDFPATPGAFDESYNRCSDVFVAKLNADGSDLVYTPPTSAAGIKTAATASLWTDWATPT